MKEILICRGLTKSRGNSAALHKTSFSLFEARFTALCGAAGAGKTTLLKLIAGFLRPDEGEITICGKKQGVKTKELTGFLPDRDFLPHELKTGKIIEMYSAFFRDFDKLRAAELFSFFAIDRCKQFGALSKAQKRRTQLCLILSRNAPLILLDEPFSDEDRITREFILSQIKRLTENGSCVVASSRRADAFEDGADDYLLLQSGTVRLIDSAENIKSSTDKSIDEYFSEVVRC